MIEIQTTLNSLVEGYGNTVSLYGLTYLIIEHKKEFKEIENSVIDILLESFSNVPDQNYFYVSDNNSEMSYYFSHYYNFSLNLLTYSAFRRFSARSNYRKKEIEVKLKDIKSFLIYEQQFLIDDEQKTIGFELVVNKFIDDVSELKNSKVARHYKEYAAKKLRKFSPILAFTPEGIKGFFNEIKLNFFVKKIQTNDYSDRVFLFDSPELTLKYINKFDDAHQNFLKNFIKIHRGLPPKFSAEYFDLFWSIDILNSAELIDPKIKELLVKIIDDAQTFSNAIGAYDPRKGFSIAKGFALYDSDTTAMAVKSLKILHINEDIISNYNYDYYFNPQTNLYSTYKNDNRPSISVLTHILNSQIFLNKIDSHLLQWLNKEVLKDNFTDKFHLSKIYTLYGLAICYTDLYEHNGQGIEQLKHILQSLLSYRKADYSYSAIPQLDQGTLEETAWAVLALNYMVNKVPELANNQALIKNSQDYISKNFKAAKSLEKLWIIKQPYNPFKISETLLYAAMNIKLK